MPCLDALARPINYLRISITDRCNLRCVYCMPAEGIPNKCAHGDLLTFEEIARVVAAAASLGISKIRLTGGEPLARLGLADLVRMIAGVPGVDDISMTTNGVQLARCADELKAAGLHRVNVSLDTLRPERFAQITRLGRLEDTLAGIVAAERAGLTPVKINTVVMRGLNDDEVADFARLTLAREWHIRFIEVMPVGAIAGAAVLEHVSMQEIKARIAEAVGPLTPTEERMQGNGPARYFRLAGGRGTIGFISAVSEHFCFHCNRLRLTADGKLRPCLLSDAEVDVRAALRRGADVAELAAILQTAVQQKPAGHQLSAGVHPTERQMAQIGG